MYYYSNMKSTAITQTNFSLPNQTNLYHGKVRDMYTIGQDYMIAVATDRISAFDVVLPRPIPYKGQVLNQIAAHFLKETADVTPNWLMEVPDPNVSLGRRFEPIKIEMIVRGILVGSAWRNYQAGGRDICGVSIPDGMQEYDAFSEPILTPTTKADEGHDEDITPKEIVAQGLATQEEWDKLAEYAQKLFARGQEMARARGLLLADTKYEFGKGKDGIYLIDEVHTADSSRYFYAESYDAYIKDRNSEKPKQLSKEFLREWLIAHDYSGQKDQKMPELPDDLINQISERYIELYEQLTGQKFEKPDADADPLKRIESNVVKALEKLHA
jgi:phosphoribosylaminoimidazole-succinocarboxamide synthase